MVMFTLEDETTMLLRNIRNQLACDMPLFPRRINVSATVLRRPKSSYMFGFVDTLVNLWESYMAGISWSD